MQAMGFICVSCADAASIPDPNKGSSAWKSIATEQRKRLHGKCRGGTWCDCQHKVP